MRIIRVDGAQAAAAQAGDRDAVRVDRVGFAALAGVEDPDSGRQFRRHVEHWFTVGDQALGDVSADAVAAFDGPYPVGEGAACCQHQLIAGGVGAETALSQNLLSFVDGLDRGRPLVRIHADHHTTHVLVPPYGCSHP
ncbi:MAG TPA: hypothetical protein VGR06_26055 [Actinophytocola sp.]|nr:hypothetical protein [Actinophytocola sp.]